MFASVAPAFGSLLVKVLTLLGLLPSALGPWDSGVLQEALCFAPLAALLLAILLACRLVQSCLCVRQEKTLALRLAAELERKCQLMEKVWATEKELAKMEASLQKVQAQQAASSLSCLQVRGTCCLAECTQVHLLLEVRSLIRQLTEVQALKSRQQLELVTLQEEFLMLQKLYRCTCTHLPGTAEPGPAGP